MLAAAGTTADNSEIEYANNYTQTATLSGRINATMSKMRYTITDPVHGRSFTEGGGICYG